MNTEEITQAPDAEVITFDPPIDVNSEIIAGGLVVTSAQIIPQDDASQIVAMIFGDGRVIGVPFDADPETSIRNALS